jgi:hypothetical protein
LSFGLMVALRLYFLPPLPQAQQVPLESPLP